MLYLYNNKIRTMEALESAPNIELLYLQVPHLIFSNLSQNNRISRLSGLDKLKKLKKLYLTKNRIQVFEGLTTNKHLEEVAQCGFSMSKSFKLRCISTDKI